MLDPAKSCLRRRRGPTLVATETINNQEDPNEQHPKTSATTSTQLPQRDVCSELPEVIRSHVHHVIQSSLDADTSLAYRTVHRQAPWLILLESDPVHFVRYCQYDLWAAAQRLCRYWTERRKLFGADRAYLPLTLTGTGALTQQDVWNVLSGALTILPTTRSGHACCLTDRRKVLKDSPPTSRLRSFFYIFHILAHPHLQQHCTKDDEDEEEEQEDSRDPTTATTTTANHNKKPGAAPLDFSTTMDAPAPAVILPVWLMLLMVTPRDHNIDWNFMHQACSLTRHAFFVPLHFRLLCIPHKNKLPLASYLLQGAVQLLQQFFGNTTEDDNDNNNETTTDNQPAQLKTDTTAPAPPQQPGAPSNNTAASSSSSSLNIQVYMQTDPHRILRHLVQDLGMTLSSIPQFLGGQWEYSQFYAWCQDRTHWEHHQFAAHLLDDKEESAGTSTTTSRQQQQQQASTQSPLPAAATTVEPPILDLPTATTTTTTTDSRKRKRPGINTARDALPVDDSRAAFPATAIAAFGGNDWAASATATRTTNPPPHHPQQQPQAQRTTPELQLAWNDMDPQNKVLLGTNKGGASYWKPTSTTHQKQPPTTTKKKKKQHKPKEPPTTTTMIEASIRNSLCQDDRLAKRRLADLFHSRRKRERKRQYVQALQQECTNLQHEQVQLQQRHGELQTWWNQARKVLFLHGVTEIGPCPIPITTNTATTRTEPMTTTTTTTRNGN